MGDLDFAMMKRPREMAAFDLAGKIFTKSTAKSLLCGNMALSLVFHRENSIIEI